MPNIIVCEDDRSLNKLITTVLRNDGHTVFSVFNGAMALEELDNQHI